MPAFTRARRAPCSSSGPTGSGKTSTIYAVLSEVNTRSKSIVSVEDPVEFRLDGIKQIQINPRAGVTFPTALPSVLRSDPDVVLIGEVRDTETARIAADAVDHRSPRAVDLARDARRGRADAAHRHGRRALPRRVGAHARRVATPRRASSANTAPSPPTTRPSSSSASSAPKTSLLDGATVRRAVGLPGLPEHRLPRPAADLRDHARHRRHQPPDRRPRVARADRRPRRRGGHGHVAPGCDQRVVLGDLSVEEMLRIVS